jgi:hypothetical protein
MGTLLLLVLLLDGHVDWEIRDTGIFTPLELKFVAVGDDDHVIMSAFTLGHLLHFHQGGLQNKIGRKGSGPGEFRYVAYFAFQEGLVHAFSLPRSSYSMTFDPGGELLRTHRFPDYYGFFPLKTRKGWIYIRSSPGHPIQALTLSDESFENKRTILEWKQHDDDEPGGTRLIVSRDGSTAFFHKPGSFEIYVIDTVKGDFKRVLRKDIERLPITDAWREQRQAKFRKLPKQAREVLTKVDQGSWFPFVKDLLPGPDNSALIYYNAHFVHDDLAPLVLDASGSFVDPSFSAAATARIVDVREGWAYVTTFDGEVAGLAKVKISYVNEFVRRRPLARIE